MGYRSGIAFKKLSTEDYCEKSTAVRHVVASTDRDSD